MKKFLRNNWEKVVGIFISVILSGLVGFFSAVLTIKSDMHSIDSRVTVIETKSKTFYEPEINKIAQIEKALDNNRAEIDTLKQQNEFSAQINRIIDSRLKQQEGQLLRDVVNLIDKTEAKQRKP